MQQNIIFLKSELMKYQNEVKKHEESDYYSLTISLEQENAYLKSAMQELSREHHDLKVQLEKTKKDEQEINNLLEKQQIKQLETIEALQRENEELIIANKHIKESLYTIQTELSTIILNNQKMNETNTMKAIEKLELQFHDFTYQLLQQLHLINETLEQKSIHAVDQLINEKTNETKPLIKEILKYQQQQELYLEKIVSNGNSHTHFDLETFSHLKVKIQKILSQSLDFEQQLDEKMKILQELDQKISELSDEMDENPL